jgi:probable HAF family extracellular repeat protein
MNRQKWFRRLAVKSFTRFFGLVLAGISVVSLQAQQKYKVIFLEQPKQDRVSSYEYTLVEARADNINENGDIGGSRIRKKVLSPYVSKFLDAEAVIWKRDGTSIGLEKQFTLPSTGFDAINDHLTAAGAQYGEENGAWFIRPFMWKNGLKTDLPHGGDFVSVRSINNADQVVGSCVFPPLIHEHAALWQNGEITDLVPNALVSVASDINKAGQIVGQYYGADGSRAFLWQNGTFSDVGLMMKEGRSSSGVPSINDLGDITYARFTGWSYPNTVLCRNGVVETVVPKSYPCGINNHNQIVGSMHGSEGITGMGNKAFLWDNGVLTYLNDVIVRTPETKKMVLTRGEAINDKGEICAIAKIGDIITTVLLIPVAE